MATVTIDPTRPIAIDMASTIKVGPVYFARVIGNGAIREQAMKFARSKGAPITASDIKDLEKLHGLEIYIPLFKNDVAVHIAGFDKEDNSTFWYFSCLKKDRASIICDNPHDLATEWVAWKETSVPPVVYRSN